MSDLRKVRRKNAIGAAPPPAIIEPAPHERFAVIERTVTKNGAISIKGLRQGSKVNVLQIDDLTFMVSGRPPDEICRLAANIPVSAPSPFAAMSDQLRGQPHAVDATRLRHPFVGETVVPALSDDLALASGDLRRTQRLR